VQAGENSIPLVLENTSPGIYLINIQLENSSETLKWVH
jgi:hypothetical protein